MKIETKGKSLEQILGHLTTNIYNLEADHFRMAELLQLHPEKRSFEFDRLRKQYPVRREFHNTNVRLLNGDTEWLPQVAGLGFKIER